MSEWWDVPTDSPKTKAVLSELAPCSAIDNNTPGGDSVSSNEGTSFWSIDVRSEPSVPMREVDPTTLVLDLKNFSGTITLKKNLPQSKFTSSFNTTIDSIIKPVLSIPTWLTSDSNDDNNNNISGIKRKNDDTILPSVKEVHDKIKEKSRIPRKITAPIPAMGTVKYNDEENVITAADIVAAAIAESSDTNDQSSGILTKQSMSRSSHVGWTLPESEGVAFHGGLGEDGVFGDVLFLRYAYNDDANTKNVNMTASRALVSNSLPRYGHTATLLRDQGLVVAFGGRAPIGPDMDDVPRDTLDVLDIALDLWYPPSVSGKAPSARTGHSSGVLLDGRAILYYGGEDKNGRFPHNIHWLDTNIRQRDVGGRCGVI